MDSHCRSDASSPARTVVPVDVALPPLLLVSLDSEM
jgi:hypothetical protein